MNNWQIDLFSALHEKNSMQDVVDVALKAVQPLGFTFCTWKTRLAFPLVHRRSCVLGSSEDKVHQKNAAGGYDEAPITTHCSKTTVPAIWTGRHEGAIFEKDPALLEEFFGWGHKGGWAQSVMEGAGQFSMFLVDSAEIMPQSYLEHEVGFHLEWITTAVHSAMSQLRQQHDVQLSLREKEILRWSGDGKTLDQIAQILNISASTVNFHMRNAMLKLDAPNKTAAVVRAIFLGLLH
ncbi:LuxR C-terminal-related transcriptional regulator [Zymobacter sp. IVIA_5232.4 C2]|uniref:helix-turn-helix transcriptional regulator n=1 Tax=Zymobacter sp. IVIA_5232.4 C2 TaxID=3394855 RepID=UPI0039C37B57